MLGVVSTPGGADTYGSMRSRLMHIARLLVGGVEVAEVLQNVARAACEVAGYDRCVVATAEGLTLRGRAGYGVSDADVESIDLSLAEVPELARLLPGREPLVLVAEEVARAIPEDYVDLFDIAGTLVVIPLSSSSTDLRGLVFVDRAGKRFTPSQDELRALVDFADVAALVLQNAILSEDSRVLAAVLERSRMATGLHDGVTQMLFAVDLALQEALAVPRLPAGARQHIVRAQQDVASSSQQLRAALFELTQEPEQVPAARHDAQLAPAPPRDQDPWLSDVRVIVDEFFRRSGIGVDLQVRGEGRKPQTAALDILLRTVREGLANVVKHAQATEVTVVVRRSDHWWMAEVHDDGVADPTALRRALAVAGARPGADSGYGLLSLKQQASRVGGRLWLSTSTRLQGLQVTTSVPTGPEA
ncbi:MAG: diguanylate cyclase [Frankiales bacterium]|jgi:signal transduction histidine kinase|nr:diguanylate cyclase [Frankiales bacterium]